MTININTVVFSQVFFKNKFFLSVVCLKCGDLLFQFIQLFFDVLVFLVSLLKLVVNFFGFSFDVQLTLISLHHHPLHLRCSIFERLELQLRIVCLLL